MWLDPQNGLPLKLGLCQYSFLRGQAQAWQQERGGEVGCTDDVDCLPSGYRLPGKFPRPHAFQPCLSPTGQTLEQHSAWAWCMRGRYYGLVLRPPGS